MSWVKFGTSDISEWILEYNPETKEIKWRDHWVVEKLSKKKKQQIESLIIKLIDNETNGFSCKKETRIRANGNNNR